MVRKDVGRVRLKSVSEEDFSSCVDSVVWIMCEECGYKHYVPIRCGRRTCPECAFYRFLEMKEKYKRFKNPRNAKFLTLTLIRSWDLEDLIERAIDCFKKLRRRKIFRKVKGGFYSIEVKPPTAEGWFVHIHAVISGPFIPEGKISEEWIDLTGDSYVVKITDARFRKNIVYYVLGYTSNKAKIKETWKGVPEWRKEKFEEAVKNRRLIQPFGNFFGIVYENPEPFKCPKCGCTEWIFLGIEHIEKEERERKTIFEWVEADPPPA
ncbi:hypothetical protein AKJ66_04195 [candidate division MSBL1 archaeon SCGC-AAA259E22]|uniref:Replication protein n=1 Tax=candidate division MSBL1 archaeon SCGC-AAA259E22 TaxID=1698265 RepID=A0A133UE05_9EURY|nr:hypothetical protein AKJ66_04195 [candidate division MSBL1 archaeon SCGC-AAA259E22]